MTAERKISLITLQYINNYGSVLQTYASHAYLESKGYAVETVNYTRENCGPENLRKTMKAYYRQTFKLPFLAELLVRRWHRLHVKREKVFDGFRDQRILLSREYTSAQQLMQEPPEAHIYCVGSDQVWNYLYNDGVLPEYYLQYAPKGATKFSLASSLGIEQLEDEGIGRQMKEYLKDFSLITVRESTGKQLLDSLGVENCHQILDPTLLIPGARWISGFGLKKPRDYDYVLVYQLNPCKEMRQFARQIARKHGCKLIIISNNIRMSVPGAEVIDNPKVELFLELVLHARCVVTDSFHGTAFSLNFHRDIFAWMPGKYSTRLMSVLKLVGLEERAFTRADARWETLPPIDYRKVEGIFAEERAKADRLVEEVLSSHEK